MSASEVQICNLGLLKFGDVTITALSDDNREARACNVLYPILRDQLLYAHPWNFAMARADISPQRTDDPAFGYEFAYTIPADCLRVWELFGESEWEVEGDKLLTNQEEEIFIRYIKRQTETGRFNPSFVNCLGTLLGAELAAKIKGDKNHRLSLLDELYKIELPAAYRLNAIEGKRTKNKDEQPLDSGNFTWQTEGR